MKKSSLTTIANYIKNVPELADVYSELAAELAKGEEKAAANRNLYETAHDVIMKHITDVPQTVAEIYAAAESELPEGFSKSKVQYALLHYWNEEVVKIENTKTPNEYRKA